MNDQIFLDNFRFNEYCYDETVHRDNSAGVDFHFIGYIKRGRGLIISDGMRLEIAENEMFYIPKGCKYHSYWIAEGIIRFDSIGFLYFPSRAKNGYSLQKIKYDEEIFKEFYPLSRDKTVDTCSIGQLYKLLGRLDDVMTEAPPSRRDYVVENLVLFMKADPHKTVAEYAFDCGVSETLLYSYVKKVLQKTPNRLRQEILCEKAKDLLTSTDLAVEEICDRLHFSSASYFRKVLYSIYKKTPSQIRKNVTEI